MFDNLPPAIAARMQSARQRGIADGRADVRGNIHATKARADFVNWRISMAKIHGDSPADWPKDARDQYDARYVPSH